MPERAKNGVDNGKENKMNSLAGMPRTKLISLPEAVYQGDDAVLPEPHGREKLRAVFGRTHHDARRGDGEMGRWLEHWQRIEYVPALLME